MFYYIEGIVAHTEQNIAVIDCNGVGYMCSTSGYTLGNIKHGSKAKLYTYLHVREDIFDLYGFCDMEELNCFKMLIGVSGVGPKAALSILSAYPPSKVALSIITGDEKVLTAASGIGKKIAQRIVLELSEKMSKQQLATSADSFVMPNNSGKGSDEMLVVNEALSALMVLGYSQAEAMQVISSMNTQDMTSEEIIKQCLKRLVR